MAKKAADGAKGLDVEAMKVLGGAGGSMTVEDRSLAYQPLSVKQLAGICAAGLCAYYGGDDPSRVARAAVAIATDLAKLLEEKGDEG